MWIEIALLFLMLSREIARGFYTTFLGVVDILEMALRNGLQTMNSPDGGQLLSIVQSANSPMETNLVSSPPEARSNVSTSNFNGNKRSIVTQEDVSSELEALEKFKRPTTPDVKKPPVDAATAFNGCSRTKSMEMEGSKTDNLASEGKGSILKKSPQLFQFPQANFSFAFGKPAIGDASRCTDSQYSNDQETLPKKSEGSVQVDELNDHEYAKNLLPSLKSNDPRTSDVALAPLNVFSKHEAVIESREQPELGSGSPLNSEVPKSTPTLLLEPFETSLQNSGLSDLQLNSTVRILSALSRATENYKKRMQWEQDPTPVYSSQSNSVFQLLDSVTDQSIQNDHLDDVNNPGDQKYAQDAAEYLPCRTESEGCASPDRLKSVEDEMNRVLQAASQVIVTLEGFEPDTLNITPVFLYDTSCEPSDAETKTDEIESMRRDHTINTDGPLDVACRDNKTLEERERLDCLEEGQSDDDKALELEPPL